ncbi:MAG TPA: c-type cytochrome [Myxococcota bacterium]|jgi:cytochrome c oxidase cbb3-type subunit 2|nr:c-type cytochrome [Myxococcota bacterium]
MLAVAAAAAAALGLALGAPAAARAAEPAGKAAAAPESAPAAPATLDGLAAEVASLSDSLAKTRAELDAVKLTTSAAAADALMDTGRGVYNRACAACHGRAGNGKGPAARYLDPLPRDFTTGEYKFRTTPSGTLPTEADLLRTVREGIPGTAMPAWKTHLTSYETRAVVAYVRGFSPRFATETIDSSTLLAVPAAAPPPTPESVKEGAALYKLLKCWDCHGTTGKGDGPSAKTLKDSAGRKIEAWNFTRGAYKGGASGTAIYRTFNTGLDGTPMPSFADTLAFGREAGADLSEITRAMGAPAAAEVAEWLATQPTGAEVEAMGDAGRGALLERRRWALVHYVQSLTGKRGVLDYLFHDKPGRLDVPY